MFLLDFFNFFLIYQKLMILDFVKITSFEMFEAFLYIFMIINRIRWELSKFGYCFKDWRIFEKIMCGFNDKECCIVMTGNH
jgi:hypothetical protein